MAEKKQAKKGGEYTAGQIQVLKGLEAVRKRPGMYIGSTSARGLHHLVYEVVDNSIDEAMAGYCSEVEVTIHEGDSVTVVDDGRGIPVDVHPVEKVPGVELAMTTLHAGGKFDKDTYKVSGGLHGVGVSVVNALSEWLEVEVRRDGRRYHQRFERGIKTKELEDLGSAKGTGTRVSFQPDHEIFTETLYNFDTLSNRLRELAFLNKGLKIILVDERAEKPVREEYRYEGGLAEYVQFLRGTRKPLHDTIIYFEAEKPEAEIELAMQYDEGFSENTHTFVNNINTHEGGSHLTGLKAALTRTINDYARRNNIFKKDESLSGDDVREGLTCVLSVKVMEPQFEGQTKTKLGNSEVRGAVEAAVNEHLTIFLDENPKAAKAIIEKSLQAARAREAARKARDLARKKSALEGGVLPGKLADCSLNEPSMCEIYLVEGDSAGGCFSGDTRVALADGRTPTFVELVAEDEAGKENFCYTIRRDGTIGLERILHPRVTKRGVPVVRVVLDNGEAITCTPDHRFMLRDGTYRRADALQPHDSLMPLYRKLSDMEEPGITIDGYEMVWDPRSDSWLFTHVLADWYNRWKKVYSVDDGDHCHHVDFDKRNNAPPNIRRMPAADHLELHRRHVEKTLHRPDVIERGRRLRKSPAFRRKMSERMTQPETRKVLSDQAKEQWRDPEYREFMARRWREFFDSNEEYRSEVLARLNQGQRDYWANAAFRKERSNEMRRFYEEHPEAKDALSEKAKRQWADAALREWRASKTSEQWTPEFRASRREALHRTYYRKTIAALNAFASGDGVDLERYREARRASGDTSVLTFATFCARYFDGDERRALDAVRHHNHKVVRVEPLDHTIDVYDLEVPGTHNFALAAGVFVHNSAKMGRDRQYQAILPLKGKILNTERARIDKILSNDEIRAMITAIGAGIRDDFDLKNARYHKIIVMSVDAEEHVFVREGEATRMVRIGEFVDAQLGRGDVAGVSGYEKKVGGDLGEVLCFGLDDHEVRFRPIRAVLRHPLDEALFEVRTAYGRTVRVTASHSVFVHEAGEVRLKKGDELQVGDHVVAPRRIRLPETAPRRIDLLRALHADEATASDVWVRGPAVEDWYKARVMERVTVGPSWLEDRWEREYRAAPANRVRTYVRLSELDHDDLVWFADRDDLRLTPEKHADHGVPRYLEVTNDLAFLLGFYLAEGWVSARGGIRLAIGRRNQVSLDEVAGAMTRVFGIAPSFYAGGPDRAGELKLVNRVAAHAWARVFGFDGARAATKCVPDLIFGLPEEGRAAFLRGYLMGDGTLSGGKLAFATTSRDTASGVMYLLSSFGVMSSLSAREPDGVVREIRGAPCVTKSTSYTVTVTARSDLEAIREVWAGLDGAAAVESALESAWPEVNRRFDEIDGDLVGLPVVSIEEVTPTNGHVYDFSVETDENFVAGVGGICCHNTDADVDGSHIRTLLLTFFFRQMPELIEAGYIYIAQPPLYRVHKGSKEFYAYNEDERIEYIKRLGGKDGDSKGIGIQRYKGLGEMNPDQLWETTMDPETRTLMRVQIEDGAIASQLFDRLMGDDVEPRREFIEKNAKFVRNLDV